MLQPQTLVLTGLSGSGRSTVLNLLEDLGYFVMDNFLPALIPAFLALPRPHHLLALEIPPTAPEGVHRALTQLKEAGLEPRLIFVEATTPVLLARYALTRRPHPLIHRADSLEEAIEQEREFLTPLRQWAWGILDTTESSVKVLRSQLETLLGGQILAMTVTLMSFGYKYSVPTEANLVFDVRFLPNPYYELGLRPLTGLDQRVVDYVFSYPEAQATFTKIADTTTFFLTHYRQERRGQVTIAIGCTGGQHRSVAFVETLAQQLSPPTDQPWRIRVHHREQQMRSLHD